MELDGIQLVVLKLTKNVFEKLKSKSCSYQIKEESMHLLKDERLVN